MTEQRYTLDEALAVVAKASFYEDKCITPEPGSTMFLVSDTTTHATEEWTWTYEKGLAHRESVGETSRMHEAFEHYDVGAHIGYNMPESVALLEARTHKVEFAYAVVDVDMSDPAYDPSENADNTAGWILVANHYELSDEEKTCEHHREVEVETDTQSGEDTDLVLVCQDCGEAFDSLVFARQHQQTCDRANEGEWVDGSLDNPKYIVSTRGEQF